MSPQAVPAAGRTRSGLNLDADIEAGIAGTRARNEAALLGMAAPRLDNNPMNPIYSPSVSRTSDEVRAAEAIASSPIEEVVVTAPKWSMGDDVIYRHAMNTGFQLPRATRSVSSGSSYRDGFVQRAGVLSDAFHVSPGYVKNTYDSAVAEYSNSNNSWGSRLVNFAGATAMFPLMVGEEVVRGALNIPSAFFGAIPAADRGGALLGEAFDTSLPASDRIIAGGYAVQEFAAGFVGLGGPASFATSPMAAAPLTSEQLALRGFQGAEATAAARATYRVSDSPTSSRGAYFFDEDVLPYIDRPDATLGRTGEAQFFMPLEDSAVVIDAASAYRYSGGAPSLERAYVSGRDVFGVEFPLNTLSPRLPTAADTTLEHFLEGGYTALKLPSGGGYLVNPTREFVIPGGSSMPSGAVLFRIGPDGARIPIRSW